MKLPMPKWKPFIVAAVALLVLDAIYLNFNKQTFLSQIRAVQKSELKINLWSVLLCYAFILFGLYFFIWKDGRSVTDAAILGAIIYGVYDTTTVALLKDWSPVLAAVDVVWGAFLFAAATFVYRKF
jgi:uncharacterized membrane protein